MPLFSEKKPPRINGTSTQVWLFFFFAAIASVMGFFMFTSALSTFWNVVLGMGALFFGGISVDLFWNTKRVIELKDDEIHFYRGFLSRHKKYELSDFSKIEINYKEKHNDRKEFTKDFKTCKLEEIEQEYQVEKLFLSIEGRDNPIEIARHNYSDEDYDHFIHEFHAYFLDVTATLEEKAEGLDRKITDFITEDKNILEELESNLQEVYRSVFQRFSAEEGAIDLYEDDILFRTRVGRTYFYYKKEAYLSDASQESIEIALNLIKATEENRKVAEARLNSYRAIRKKVKDLMKAQRQRERLTKAAETLNRIQSRNINKKSDLQDFQTNVEVLDQFELIAQYAHELNTLHQSEVLKEHIGLVSEFSSDEHESLRQMNEEFLNLRRVH